MYFVLQNSCGTDVGLAPRCAGKMGGRGRKGTRTQRAELGRLLKALMANDQPIQRA